MGRYVSRGAGWSHDLERCHMTPPPSVSPPPQPVTLYGSSMLGGAVPAGQPLEMEGASQPGLVTKSGLVLTGSDGKAVSSRSG